MVTQIRWPLVYCSSCSWLSSCSDGGKKLFDFGWFLDGCLASQVRNTGKSVLENYKWQHSTSSSQISLAKTLKLATHYLVTLKCQRLSQEENYYCVSQLRLLQRLYCTLHPNASYFHACTVAYFSHYMTTYMMGYSNTACVGIIAL